MLLARVHTTQLISHECGRQTAGCYMVLDFGEGEKHEGVLEYYFSYGVSKRDLGPLYDAKGLCSFVRWRGQQQPLMQH